MRPGLNLLTRVCVRERERELVRWPLHCLLHVLRIYMCTRNVPALKTKTSMLGRCCASCWAYQHGKHMLSELYPPGLSHYILQVVVLYPVGVFIMKERKLGKLYTPTLYIEYVFME